MSPSEGTAGEKVYHFISDPDHKENLSGRVRAACMNCRRKKIKCSGEASCRTCFEKGLVCEGPPERKKPRRSIDLTSSQDFVKSRQDSASLPSTDGNASSSRRTSFNNSDYNLERKRSKTQRPTDTLAALSSVGSSDSGYFSGAQSPKNMRLNSMASISSTFSNFDNVPQTSSSSTTNPSDWNFYKAQAVPNYLQTEAGNPVLITNNQHTQSLTGSKSPTDWSEAKSTATWWPRSPTDGSQEASAFSDLMSTATMLEERAQALRQLAFHQASEGMDSMNRQARRVPMSTHSETPTLMSNGPEHSDLGDMRLLFGEGGTSTGLTPLAANQSHWWGGVDGDISSNLNIQLPQDTAQHDLQQPNKNTSHFTADSWDAATRHVPPATTSRHKQPCSQSRYDGKGHRDSTAASPHEFYSWKK